MLYEFFPVQVSQVHMCHGHQSFRRHGIQSEVEIIAGVVPPNVVFLLCSSKNPHNPALQNSRRHFVFNAVILDHVLSFKSNMVVKVASWCQIVSKLSLIHI